MLPAILLYDLLGIGSWVLKHISYRIVKIGWGGGLDVFLSISTNEIGFEQLLQLL